MTQTLSKRNSRGAVYPHAAGVEVRGPHRPGHADASELATRLRDLALRAHRLVQDAQASGDEAVGPDLRELRASLLRLEADILDQNLQGLLTYVEALRQQVELLLD
ncbi:MAG: hypothetical protein U0835_00665 [Isosphaeraceae bacterium]